MPPLTGIIGHEKQRSELLLDLEEGKLAHAYLFSGHKHLGKFTVARWFAEEIFAFGKTKEEAASLRTQVRRNMHPDLLVLDQLWIEGVCTDWNIIAKSSTAPQSHRTKAKIKTDTIGIDDIRALQERLHETPQAGRITCCLIRSIERLHLTAANAFLKILEEPPSHVVFCLTSESSGAVPQTVLSRLRILQFSPLPRQQLLTLVEGMPEEDQALLLGVANGAPGVILECKEDADQLRLERQARIDARLFLKDDSPSSRFRNLQEVFLGGDHAQRFLRQVLLQLQNDLRSTRPYEVMRAQERLRCCMEVLHTLQSNTNRSLLAAQTALLFPSASLFHSEA